MEEEDAYSLPADYKPYVPVAKRRAALMANLGVVGASSKRAKRTKTAEEDAALKAELAREIEDAAEKDEREKEKARRVRTLLQEAQEVKKQRQEEGECTLVVGSYTC